MTNQDVSNLISKLNAEKNVELLHRGNASKAPKAVSYKNSRQSFTPDIIAVYPNKHDYYVVEKKITASKLPTLISKWILFALLARMKSGKCFLVVRGEKVGKRCQDIIDDKLLAVELIVIQ